MLQTNEELIWRRQKCRDNLDLSFCVFASDSDFIGFLKTKDALELESINLSHTLLSDACLLQLGYLKQNKLKYLDISYCVNFTEGAIVNLLNSDLMQNIEILNLSGDSLSDITLKYILQNHRLKHLAHLTLNDIRKGPQGFTYRFFEYMANTTLSKSLRFLSVGNSFVGEEQLEPTNPQKIVKFFLNKIVNEDFTFFSQMSLKSTIITQLQLNRCDLLTNKFFKMLSQNNVFLGSLQMIDVSHSKHLTDKSLSYLSEAQAITKLTEMHIAGLRITSNGLDKLSKNPRLNLQSLNVSMCDEVTGQDIKQLLESRLGKGLLNLELSGSGNLNSQVQGCFTNESVIWKDFQLKQLLIELLIDKGTYYQSVSKEQQIQQSHSLDPFYKSFVENHCWNIFNQLVFVRNLKVIMKVQLQDETQFLEYLLLFAKTKNLLDKILQHDNSLFINDICFLSYILAQITKAEVNLLDSKEIKTKYKGNLIQNNYIDPIQKEGICASKIKNLILIRQDNLQNTDLKIIGEYSNSVFQELIYLSLKGCRQITYQGLEHLNNFKNQLNFLDVRKTQIKEDKIFQILRDFPQLTNINNNKLKIMISSLVEGEEFQLLERLQGINKLRIISNRNTQNQNLATIQRISKIVHLNYLSITEIDLRMKVNIIERNLTQDEAIVEFCETLKLCYNLQSCKFTFKGTLLHQILCDITGSLLQIKKLELNMENCQFTQEIQQCQGLSYFNLHILQINITQLNLLDQLLFNVNNLTDFNLKLDQFDQSLKQGKSKALIQLLNWNILQSLKLELDGIRNEQIQELLINVNGERLNEFSLVLNNIQLNEQSLSKIAEFLGKAKKIQNAQIQMIGCLNQGLYQEVDRYFKSNVLILRIPELKFYY